MKKALGTITAIMVAAILIGTSITAKSSSVKETGGDGRFIAYDNGTVLDTKTNLMWAAKDNGTAITWKDAKSYCENYRGGGYTDWRMPTQAELEGLYEVAKGYKSDCAWNVGRVEGPVHITELIRLTCGFVWASEKRGIVDACFCFITGKGYWYHPNPHHALPVRSGKIAEKK